MKVFTIITLNILLAGIYLTAQWPQVPEVAKDYAVKLPFVEKLPSFLQRGRYNGERNKTFDDNQVSSDRDRALKEFSSGVFASVASQVLGQCHGGIQQSVVGTFFTWKDGSMQALLLVAVIVGCLPLFSCILHYYLNQNASENSWRPILDRMNIGKKQWIAYICVCLGLTATLIWFTETTSYRPTCAHKGYVYGLMFCERGNPSTAFVAHPANAWSNLPYFYFGVYLVWRFSARALRSILSSLNGSAKHAEKANVTHTSYLKFDTLFGIMLVCLFCCSFLWHSTGCPHVHYYDLTCMYSVMGAYPLRYVTMALEGYFTRRWYRPTRQTHHYDTVLTVLYAGIILSLLAQAVDRHSRAMWSTEFPSGRSRDPNELAFRWEIVGFVIVPMAYWVVLTVCGVIRRQLGQSICSIMSGLVLVSSWFLHMSEKWALDIYCCPDSWVQPTAIFHVMTGITIVIAYVQVVSIDLQFPNQLSEKQLSEAKAKAKAKDVSEIVSEEMNEYKTRLRSYQRQQKLRKLRSII